MFGEQQVSPVEHAPPWSLFSDRDLGRSFPLPVSGVSVHGNFSGDDGFIEALSSLQRFLPSNNEDLEDSGIPIDAYTCDEFRMYDFKVRRCVRGRSHDWTECPYAHPGEKARRRDPRKFHYSGTACPDFRKGTCKRGDNCEFAHGVFECWLHPARYRTQPCKDGTSCRRRVCFFAHTPEQLRVLPQNPVRHSLANLHSPSSPAGDSYDGSPLRQALTAVAGNFDGGYFTKPGMISSPTSTLTHAPHSPPLSPSISPPLSPDSRVNPSLLCSFSPHQRQVHPTAVNGVLASLRNLQINRAKATPWSPQIGIPGFNSPRASSNLRPVFNSLPSTPTQSNWVDIWDTSCTEEEPPGERVESGRDLRAKIFEKLSKQNPVEKPEGPDVGWVSELVK